MTALSKKQRAMLYAMFGGHCAYCGCILPERGWHADHIEPIQREGKYVRVEGQPYSHKYVQTGRCFAPENNRVENLFPSCRSCNINKSGHLLEDWRSYLERSIDGMRRDHASFRHAERFGLVAQVETKVVFYFEKLRDQSEVVA